jgi:hypothetical protein
MPNILYAILQNGIIVGFALIGGWLMVKNIRRQMQSEDTERDDKK